jgi:hypothetical protein
MTNENQQQWVMRVEQGQWRWTVASSLPEESLPATPVPVMRNHEDSEQDSWSAVVFAAGCSDPGVSDAEPTVMEQALRLRDASSAREAMAFLVGKGITDELAAIALVGVRCYMPGSLVPNVRPPH